MSFRILFICTSASTSSWGSGPVGLWLDELAVPFLKCSRDAGYVCEIATVQGGAPAIDPASNVEDNKTDDVRTFLGDDQCMRALQSAVRVSDVSRPADYAAVALLGGHGACMDFHDNADIKRIVEGVFSAGGVVYAICHGPLALLNCVDSTSGKALVSGRFVAGFSDEEEASLGLSGKPPVSVEQALDRLGAMCIPAEAWQPHAIVDGRLVTAQNPASSTLGTERLLDVLRSLGGRFWPGVMPNVDWYRPPPPAPENDDEDEDEEEE